MRRDRRFALIFSIIGFIIAVAGILTTPGEFVGDVTWGIIMYFTIQTNILAAVLFAIFTVRLVKDIRADGVYGDSSYYPRFTMVAVVSLAMMGLSYWILLAPNSILSIWTFPNITTHGATPLLLVLYYLLFIRPGNIKHKDVYYATLFPLAFVANTYIAYALGYTYERFDGEIVNFPYFFFDYATIGWGMVSAFILGILVMVIFLGYALYFIDRKRSKRLT
ncbi:MAG: Pr6Pr family membrane protein [Defluviitaleaceae bacterium]|nr:Pr6Pr family membrane protein [Defluviitaleaceae bacterium]